MRILYIRNINQVAGTYADELARRGHTVRVYEPSLAGKDAPLPIKLALMPGRVLNMRHIVADLRPTYFDLVHIHWASYGVLGLMSRIPFIVECHGSDVRYHLQQPFFRPLLTSIFRRAAAVHCITPDLLPVVRLVRPDAIFFPGPVDTDRFTPLEEDQTDPVRPWTILLFTRLDPIKGPEITTQGIARFAQRHPDVRVQLLDWGRWKEKYKQRYRKRFEFLSLISPEKVRDLIWSADVVVGQCNLGILSFCELQAMSCAKPVIASFRYEEAYASPPPVCRATTAQEVEEHLEHLFQHREGGKELGRRAREWVIDHHDSQALAAKLEIVYLSILKRQRGELPLESYSLS